MPKYGADIVIHKENVSREEELDLVVEAFEEVSDESAALHVLHLALKATRNARHRVKVILMWREKNGMNFLVDPRWLQVVLALDMLKDAKRENARLKRRIRALSSYGMHLPLPERG